MSETTLLPTPAIDMTLPRADGAPRARALLREPQAAHGPGLQEQAAQSPQHQKCPGCGSTGARNLVVCIDGTSNQFSTKNTNVVELYSRLEKDEDQLTFYNSGIGTYAKPSWKSWGYIKQVMANKLDLAFALRFEKIILGAYAWLVENYRPGDRIFLFGFSRGAYQVRALAAMIDVVGLLYKGNNDQIPFAYELYAASEDEAQDLAQESEQAPSVGQRQVAATTAMSTAPFSELDAESGIPIDPHSERVTMQGQFKKTFSRKNVKVHFVGAWDTVSSVGFIRDKTLPKTMDGMTSTCFFRHALALHEFRVKFLPEYVNGNRGPKSTGPSPLGQQHTKEVWFAGSHSDIGGGSTENTTLDQFGPALRWMSYEAALAGLKIEEGPRKWIQRMNVSKSMTFWWRIVEWLPIKRLSYPQVNLHSTVENASGTDRPLPEENTEFSKSATTWVPHRSACRQFQEGQRIDWSVDQNDLPLLVPQPVPVEHSAYAALVLRPREEVLQRRCILDEQNSALFRVMVSSEDGFELLREHNIMRYIYDMVDSVRSTVSAHEQISADLATLYFACLQASVIFDKSISLNGAETSRAISLFGLRGHTKLVSSVAFLTPTRVVSGSWDKTIRIWDVCTGETTHGSPLSGQRNYINSVAAHEAGLVASASDDSTIRLWRFDGDVVAHPVRTLRTGGMAQAFAVAFSPDGSHLVSGSADGAIRLWNTTTGERAGGTVRGHRGSVRAVAFAPNVACLVSCSDDRTVRLWDWSSGEATLQPRGRPLTGHTNVVSSVALSRDARLLACASWKSNTIRLWDAINRTPIFSLEGHTGFVYSLAFAPDGTHLVSGSADWTSRIWNVGSGLEVRAFSGHTSQVNSVAFSPDGKRVASGSADNTVRVWDAFPVSDESPGDEVGRMTPVRVAST